MNDLLKSAIADAKAIKDTAMQNAKATLEESIFYKGKGSSISNV